MAAMQFLSECMSAAKILTKLKGSYKKVHKVLHVILK